MPLMGSSVALMILRKESVNLKIGQPKLPILECKVKKLKKQTKQNIPELWDNIIKE